MSDIEYGVMVFLCGMGAGLSLGLLVWLISRLPRHRDNAKPEMP